jgi:hypothetical protein
MGGRREAGGDQTGIVGSVVVIGSSHSGMRGQFRSSPAVGIHQPSCVLAIQGLKSRDYARSELLNLHVNRMSSNTALVAVSRIRYATDGRELERFGETEPCAAPNGSGRLRWQ